MPQSSASQIRAWTGLAIYSFGFRPFFFLGALWAAIAMTLWIAMLSGMLTLPTTFDPVSWHSHALLIGYVGAVISGFLLTAVPNWTGRLPVVGWRLVLLSTLWIIGRLAVLFSQYLTPTLVAILDLSSLIILAAMLLREIIKGKNWRNLAVIVILLMLILGGAMFHWQAAHGGYAAQGSGMRLLIGAAIMMISIVGGRIVPSFTRNWLVKKGSEIRPAPAMATYDKLTLIVSVATLSLWVFTPDSQMAAVGLLLMGVLHIIRLSRWCGIHTLSEPLVWVLHIAYAFIPLGAVAIGASILWGGYMAQASAQHLWMVGAIGLMTMAVMTRATLGHTGNKLQAGLGTTSLYFLIITAALSRLFSGFFINHLDVLYMVSAIAWISAFLGFTMLYGPLLLKRKSTKA